MNPIPGPSAIRTQKAAGCALLLATPGYNSPKFVLVQSRDGAESAFGEFKRNNPRAKCFARPCPTTPRHGFVGSRIVTNVPQIHALWDQAVSIDPESEIMLSVAMDAYCSAVWRPGMLGIGPGIDGSTAGRGSFSLNVASTIPNALASLAKQARINLKTEVPYIEAVVTGLTLGEIYHTQLRAGPSTEYPICPDYLPVDMIVNEILLAKGSEEEFLQICVARKGVPGVIIDHSDGGTMCSHYAAHGMLNGIPVACTFKPRLGDDIKKSWEQIPIDPYSVRAGVAAGSLLNLSPTNAELACRMILTGTHNMTSMGGHDGFFAGLAAILMIRIGLAAAQGEARHAREHGIARNSVYTRSFDASVFSNRMDLTEVMSLFHHHHWKGGFGGKAWAACAQSIKGLDETIQAIMKKPMESAVGRLGSALHVAVNQAHNNGWWLNKFIRQSVFDEAAQGDPRVWFSAVPIMFAAKSIPREELAEVIGKWKRTAPIPAPTKKKLKRGEIEVDYSELMEEAAAKVKKIHALYVAPVIKPLLPATKVTRAQAKVVPGGLHVQYTTDQPIHPGHYYTANVTCTIEVLGAFETLPECESLASTNTPYRTLGVTPLDDDKVSIWAGQHLLLSIPLHAPTDITKHCEAA